MMKRSFWAWHLARQIVRPSALQAQGGIPGLVRWFEARRGTELGDGAFAFALWRLDETRRDDELRALIGTAIVNPALPAHAAWLAGSRGSVRYQSLLLEAAIAHAEPVKAVLRDPNGHSLFGLLHFVGHGQAAALGGADERLLLLQPLYDAIADHALGDYFEFIAKWLIADVKTIEVIVNCFDALTGCELTGAAETLATFAYDELRDIASDADDQVTQAIVDHLRRLREAEYSAPPRRGHRNWYFWQWLVHVHARFTARRLGMEAFDRFCNWGWFEPRELGLAQPVGARVREEPKLALGWWYRSEAGADGRRRFVQRVEELLQDRSPRRREIGYFLIRHTVPLDRGQEGDVSGLKAAANPRLAVVDSGFEFAAGLASRDRSLDLVRNKYPIRVIPRSAPA